MKAKTFLKITTEMTDMENMATTAITVKKEDMIIMISQLKLIRRRRGRVIMLG